MSHQLKLNAVHFSKSLEDEKGILEASTEVLTRTSLPLPRSSCAGTADPMWKHRPGNLDRTQVSKKVLDSVRRKTGGTTWLTVGAILAVMVAFVWTYLLIRFT